MDRCGHLLPEAGQVAADAVDALLAEQDEEWATGRRYFSAESLAALCPLLALPDGHPDSPHNTDREVPALPSSAA